MHFEGKISRVPGHMLFLLNFVRRLPPSYFNLIVKETISSLPNEYFIPHSVDILTFIDWVNQKEKKAGSSPIKPIFYEKENHIHILQLKCFH